MYRCPMHFCITKIHARCRSDTQRLENGILRLDEDPWIGGRERSIKTPALERFTPDRVPDQAVYVAADPLVGKVSDGYEYC
jgi:hypothetical protein